MRRLAILTLIISHLHGLAQEIDEKNFTLYTKLDGLSQNFVMAIAQDSTGYVWIATAKGLNRFDGKSFINFFKNSEDSLLPENSIISLHVWKNEIVGGTNGGAFTFNTITGEHKKFIVPADPVIFFWSNQVFDALRDEKGTYIVSTKTGLYVFDPAGKLIYRYDHYVPADAGRRELWFGNWLQPLSNGTVFQQNGLSGSLYYPEKNRLDTFYMRRKLQAVKPVSILKEGDTSTSFKGYRDQVFFVNPNQKGIDIIDVPKNSVTFCALPANIVSELNWYSKLFFINDTTIAITSMVGGFYVFHYNTAKKQMTSTSKKLFASKYCTSIFRDRDGRLWVGTNDGLYRQNLRNSFFTTEDISAQFPDVVNRPINSIYIEKENLFLGLGNEGGVLLLDKKTKKINRRISFEKLGKGSNSILYILSYAPDSLWLGTRNSVIWLNKKNFSFGKVTNVPGEPVWMKNDRCRNYLQDSRGNIWLSFGRLNSVVVFNRNQHKFTEITSPLLKITFCFSMIEDKEGNIWLAGDGICRWNWKKNAIDLLIPYTPVGKKSPFNFTEILDVDEDNNLWLTVDNQIIEYNCAKNVMSVRVPENNIMDGDLVTNSPVIDNRIWLCLATGISAFNIKDYSVRQFNYTDGLPYAEGTTSHRGSFYNHKENLFYMGAGQFLISFTPDVSSRPPQPVPKFFVELIGSSGNGLMNTSNVIRLPHSKNNVQLRFNAINFTDPEDNRYSYRMLSDVDSTWHDLNTQNTISLNNLASGSYNIEARLSSGNNRWPEQIRTIRIIIVPPFWRRAWFLAAAILITMIALTSFYRYRIRQIRQKANLDKLLAQTEMKALHAQMNPHFIFNCLNSIREMILNNENMQASHYLSKFAQLIRITLDNSTRPFISLEDTVDYLQRYLEMERIRTENFTYSMEVEPALEPEDIFLPPMLIQPFIENAIWHGQVPGNSMQLIIRFLKKDDNLVCIIEDNGIGIEASLRNKQEVDHHSLGIANIRQRIQLLNEKYDLGSTVLVEDKSTSIPKNGTGTRVTLHLPVKSVET